MLVNPVSPQRRHWRRIRALKLLDAGESCLSFTAAAGGRHMATTSDMLDTYVYQGSETPSPPLWADVPADILGTLLRLLPCLADRASVRSVCRHWRAAARAQALPAPLPVLLLPRFRFSCLTSDGRLTGARRALLPVEAAGNDVWIVGSCDDWLMTVRSTVHSMETAGECCLVNAFSSEVVHLPRLPRNSKYNCLDVSSSARSSEYYFETRLLHSALSASPSAMSKYTVAALTYLGFGPNPGLALSQPGMASWYLCLSSQINSLSYEHLAFYQGKLYMVSMHTPYIFAFELREDEHGVSLSCPEHYKISPLIPSKTTGPRRYNLVVWRGKLLLLIRFFSHEYRNYNICNVDVFALDFSTSPCAVTQIHNFDGDCIIVQKSGCRPFSPGLHVGVQGDLIYFSDECIPHFPYVYNMRDGTVRRFAAGLPAGCTGYPIWIFPCS